MDLATTTIAGGFAFPEGPRWHGGHFWFSDQHDSLVHVLKEDGTEVDSFHVPGRPSGLGWLPNGDLLIASMQERRLYRRHAGSLSPYADLSAFHPGYSNDMVVDARGRAYVGNIGFDFDAGETFRPTAMALVGEDGVVSLAADALDCPNGTVITPDGKHLIVGESMGHRLKRFTIEADGSLSDPVIFAELGEHVPDGICLDAEGCVWVASPFGGGAIRVREGGEIVDRAPIEGGGPYACMLGGADGRTLFICVAADHAPAETLKSRSGRIDVARAPAPGAGLP